MLLLGDWLLGARCFPIKPVTPDLKNKERGEEERGGERVPPVGADCVIMLW